MRAATAATSSRSRRAASPMRQVPRPSAGSWDVRSGKVTCASQQYAETAVHGVTVRKSARHNLRCRPQARLAMPTTFHVGATPAQRAGSSRTRPLADGARSAAHRLVRAHLEQRHLRRVRRDDELLGLLPDRRRGDRLHPGLGLRDVIESRVRGRRRSASASTATGRSPTRSCCSRCASTPQRLLRRRAAPARAAPRSTTSTCAAAATRSTRREDEALQALLAAAVHRRRS